MTTNFGNYSFTDPELLLGWSAPNTPGVYCICIRNTRWQPTPFQPIYFDHTESFSQLILTEAHPAFAKWVKESGSPFRLFVAVYAMPYSTEYQRRVVERFLIHQYNPPCNRIDIVSDHPTPNYAAGKQVA